MASRIEIAEIPARYTGNSVPALRPHVEASIRDISVRIYLHDQDDYDACVQLQVQGTKAWAHSMTGAGFYLAFGEFIAKLREFGIKELSGYVRPAHARLARRQAEKIGIEFDSSGEIEEVDGHGLIWATWKL